MHLRTGLLLAALGLFPLLGCNESDSATGPSNGPTQVGTVDFTLPAALRAQVAGSADSLRVELRHGSALRSVSVALDSTAHVSDLDAGMWTISVGLYQMDGTLKYFGEDSVLIQPGKRSSAVVTLKPATGSVDIVIRLDQPREPAAIEGSWFLRRIDSTLVLDRSIPLTFGDSEHVYGTDGCNSINGAYFVHATYLTLAGLVATEMYCPDSTTPHLDYRIRMALESAASWVVRDSQLVISDSLGRERLRYARTPPVVACTLIVYKPTNIYTTTTRIETDTAGRNLLPLRIDSATANDSGVWLSVVLASSAEELHLFALDSMRSIPPTLDTTWLDSFRVVTTARKVDSGDLPEEILVAGIEPSHVSGAPQAPMLVHTFIPWSLLQMYVRFRGAAGGDFTLLPPGRVLN